MIREFIQAKTAGRVTRTKKTMQVRDNGRSADFIIPNFAVGCDLACSYCYVARHREFGNPVETYDNWQEIWPVIERHYHSLEVKSPNQCDPHLWTYDIGESTDCLSPSAIRYTLWFIDQFLNRTQAKVSFATKIPSITHLPRLTGDHKNRVRVRVSLMPSETAAILETGTMSISRRIDAISALVDHGYEVHVNFSPVVAHREWVSRYTDLFAQIDERLNDKAKAQLKCEVIFLTHHERLHVSNRSWTPAAESLLWTPQWQELKKNQRGATVLRYRVGMKKVLCDKFLDTLQLHLPYCQVRYIF